MNALIVILLLGLSLLLIGRGVYKGKRFLSGLGISLFILSLLFFNFLDFWGEYLWFQALGFEDRLLTTLVAQLIFTVAGGLIGGILILLLNLPAGPAPGKWLVYAFTGFGAFIGGSWGYSNWEVFLKFIYRVDSGIKEPVLGLDTSFYMFTLPFIQTLYALVWIFVLLALLASLAVHYTQRFEVYKRSGRYELEWVHIPNSKLKVGYSRIYRNVGLFLITMAVGKYLQHYSLLFSDWGAVHGPGWTDVHIRLPAFFVVAALTFILGVLTMLQGFRKAIGKVLIRMGMYNFQDQPVYILPVLTGLTVLLWVGALGVLPYTWQSLRVEPNEITFEQPYIANNIKFTRLGFNLHKIEEREFPASPELSSEMVQNNQSTLQNTRLWDWRALAAVYKQFQEIRLYYKFVDVDIDRYMIDGRPQQVMVSAREIELENLPEQSKTFVNQRFKYTHGYGITLTTVHDFTDNGLPKLLIKDIPPKSSNPDLEVKQPRIYYGEETRTYAIVNSKEQELDYPKGDNNTYTQYAGPGGVQIGNFWRKFIYSWKFGGTKLLLSNYPKPDSRIMFHRNILDRLHTLAPFLMYDRDPYIVLDEGKLYWMVDAYTASEHYPYSEPFGSATSTDVNPGEDLSFAGNPRKVYRSNYLRNSVKAVVDAYTGEVSFYIFDEDDRIIQVWDKIFPGLLQTREDMPKGLLNHIRYPQGMLSVQGLVFAKYHMNDPAVFYNQEDLWVRATEKYYSDVKPVSPYYIMWELPDSDKAQFVLMQPFTPKNRQVLIGWIATLCDPENYGRFLAYKFPKERRVLGPQQVETKIDQDSYLSGQLTLWDQRGSKVIRGNVLAIPIENTIIYVEPIYLQAETAAYPELRLVVVMHNDKLSYAENFEEALNGLFDGKKRVFTDSDNKNSPTSTQDMSEGEWVQRANQAFENYLNKTSAKDFEGAAKALRELEEALQNLSNKFPGTDSPQEKPEEPQEPVEEKTEAEE